MYKRILVASDGVSEVSNDEGVQLGDTELYQNTIKKAATGTAQEVAHAIVWLLSPESSYTSGSNLDVTGCR